MKLPFGMVCLEMYENITMNMIIDGGDLVISLWMFTRGQSSRSRFSLLLLGEGEYYFEDFEAIYYPSAATDQVSIRK